MIISGPQMSLLLILKVLDRALACSSSVPQLNGLHILLAKSWARRPYALTPDHPIILELECLSMVSVKSIICVSSKSTLSECTVIGKSLRLLYKLFKAVFFNM